MIEIISKKRIGDSCSKKPIGFDLVYDRAQEAMNDKTLSFCHLTQLQQEAEEDYSCLLSLAKSRTRRVRQSYDQVAQQYSSPTPSISPSTSSTSHHSN